jgi:hypothetical protein
VELPLLLTLHWGWLLAASIVVEVLQVSFHWRQDTAAIVEVFVIVLWSLVQAGWLKSADMRSKAIYWNVAIVVLNLVSLALDHSVRVPDGVDATLGIATAAFSITSIFVFRSEMQRYFNDTDDVGLKLSPWMTLFFSTLYFQYHFHKIAEFKTRHSESAEA